MSGRDEPQQGDKSVKTDETFETIVTAADNTRQRLRNGLIGLNGLSFKLSAGADFFTLH